MLCVVSFGYYQEAGKPVQKLKPGDIIVIPANIKHWHGAQPNYWFSHISVEIPGTHNTDKNKPPQGFFIWQSFKDLILNPTKYMVALGEFNVECAKSVPKRHGIA